MKTNIKLGKIFWGLFFILGGIFIILSKLTFLPDIKLINIILGVFLLAIVVKSITALNFGGILFGVAFILILFSSELKLSDITPWPVLGAALLGTIGLECIFHNWKNRHNFHFWQHNYSNSCHGKHHSECNFDKNVSTSTDPVNDIKTHFGGTVKYIKSKDFKSSTITCSFGGTEVYFDEAEIPSGNAELFIDSSFGGVELYIPRAWKVVNNLVVSMGNVEEGHGCETTGSPVLTLNGKVSFGAVEIHYV